MTTSGRKRGITIYRATDAPDFQTSDFMTPPDEAPEGLKKIQPRLAQTSPGADLRILARDAGGFSLVHVWFKPNFPLPRHTHNADCMYYVISGSAIMGRQTLRAGDSFFVPANAPYQYDAGPDGVEVLEIRHGVTQFNVCLDYDGVAKWEAFADAAEANDPKWTELSVSPTFAANAG
jgi:quercetin dioxygenase-like cupin family protein